jgi:hypothetical protein
MRDSCKQAGFVAGLILLVTIPAAAQVGGYGGMGGFGGIASGHGLGGARPDVPSVRPWLSVSGGASRFYDDTRDDKTRYGAGISGGVSVGKAWARTSLSGSYMTGGSLVTPYKYYGAGTGMSHVFGLQVMHQVTQRLAASVSTFGGSSNGGYGSVGGGLGGFGGMGPVGTSITASPSQGQINSSNIDLGFQNLTDNGLVDDELFYSRVNFAGVNAGVSYTADQRNVFSFRVGASRVRRALNYLAGLNTLGAGASYTRVLTEKLSTGASYSVGTFEYPGYYGGNQVHSVGWNIGYRINPKTSFSMHAGGFLYRVNNIGTVTLPPELAAILGTPAIQQINNYSYRGVSGGVSISRSFRVGSAGASYSRGANPGYGLLFPTLRESVSVSYGLGGNRYSVGTSGHYSRGNSISAIAGKTSSKAVAAFASYRLLGSLHVTGSASQYWLGASPISNRRIVSANVGIAFSPGSYPLWF